MEDLSKWVAFGAALHGLALTICNLTPTPKDDEAMRQFYRVIELFAGIWLPMAKR
jgi:hypothetical protein